MHFNQFLKKVDEISNVSLKHYSMRINGGSAVEKQHRFWLQDLRRPGVFHQVINLIHHNKKDGGMLIVKTVLDEFALAAYKDS